MQKVLLLLITLFSVEIACAQVTNTNISNGVGFDGEPYIALNPVNPHNIAAAWMSLQLVSGHFVVTIKTRASMDGGNTWSTAVTLPHFGTQFGSADVSMGFDGGGMLYICYIDYRQLVDSGGVYVARSTDGGLHWDAPSRAFDISDVPSKAALDRPWVAVDKSAPGVLYITTKPAPWIAPPNRPYYKVSTDSGHTWTVIATLDNGNHLTGNLIAAPMASPEVTAAGKFCAVYPSYVSAQNIYPAYYLAQSVDSGQSLFYTTVLAGVPAANDTNYKLGYRLAINDADSNKMTFLYENTPNGDADIFSVHSNDGGQTWSSPVRVNDDTIANGKGQDMVWASYNSQGNLAVTWRDRRNAAANGFWNADYDFYYAISSDNGQTFSANQKLSSQTIGFDSILTQNGNDFMSCAYNQDTLYTVWGDTRTGKMNIFFAKTIASSNTTSGIEVLEGDKDYLFAFPNPAGGQLNVIAGDELLGKQVLLYNASGKIVKRENISSTHFILSTTGLPSGVYLLKAGNQSVKVMKQ